MKEGLISTRDEKDINRIFVTIFKCQLKSFIPSFTVSKTLKEHNEDRWGITV